MPATERFTHQDCLARAHEALAHAMSTEDSEARDQYSRIAQLWKRMADSMLRHGLTGLGGIVGANSDHPL